MVAAAVFPARKHYFPVFPGSGPAKIRPGRPISGPEALLRNIEYPGEARGPLGRPAGPEFT